MHLKITYSALNKEWLVFDRDADERRDWACDPTSVVFSSPTITDCDAYIRQHHGAGA